MKQREIWIDVAKGLGIILVVLGHTLIPDGIVKFIFAFHMPLFFFISGYLFSFNSYPTLNGLVLKKAKQLLIPYLIAFFITYFYWLFIGRTHGADMENNQLWWQPFQALIYGGDWLKGIFAPLWFFTGLFVTQIYFYLTKNLKPFLVFIIIALASIGGFYLSKIEPYQFAWSFDAALLTIFFYGLGYLLKDKIKNTIDKLKPFPLIAGSILLFTLTYFLSQYNVKMSFYANIYGDYFLFIFGALAGTAALIGLAKLWQNSKILEFLGRNSLIIFAYHSILLGVYRNGLALIGLPIKAGTLYSGVIYATLDILTLTAIILIYNWLKNIPKKDAATGLISQSN